MLELVDGQGVLGRSRDIGHAGGAPHGVDQIVIRQHRARGEFQFLGAGIDVGHLVDDEADRRIEQLVVVGGSGGVTGDQLVQANPFHEVRPGVHEGHGQVLVGQQLVGRQGSRVASADHDHSGVLGHFGDFLSVADALETPARRNL
ncbi:Uncharacterised protein [Mycobacteroides abscessus subsp. abscessus]|nr:Uncharacterised protein [Mycobacteroides abscessus subsp. abscessus]